MSLVRCVMCLIVAAIAMLPAAAQLTREDAEKLARQFQGRTAGANPAPPELIELKEADVVGFIGAIAKLRELGLDTRLDGARTDTARIADALTASERAHAILDDSNLSLERFPLVAYAIGIAMAKIDGSLDDATLDGAREAQAKALAQMKGRLSQEQIDSMMAGLGAADVYVEQIRNQPARNPELVRKHLRELDIALGNASR